MLLDEFENSSKNDKKEAPTHPETSTPKRNRELFNLITTPSFVRENLETPKSKVHTNRALREMNLDENTILRIPSPPKDSTSTRSLSDLISLIPPSELPIPLIKVQMWREGKEVSFTKGEVEEWTKFVDEMPAFSVVEVNREKKKGSVKKKDGPKPK